MKGLKQECVINSAKTKSDREAKWYEDRGESLGFGAEDFISDLEESGVSSVDHCMRRRKLDQRGSGEDSVREEKVKTYWVEE